MTIPPPGTGPLTVAQAMDMAVALAELSPSFGPNPRVGSVLLGPDGTVFGQGYHRGAGTAHAEVAAIDDAHARGFDLRGATAVVTLEPCNHTGRTGPCAQALIREGVAKVVYAVADPNPSASGGASTLAAAGIVATLSPHHRALEINERWLHAMRLGRPHVTAKWAQTLDGYTAAPDGSSFWITGEEAREHVHQMRAATDAIVVGTGTVRVDNPRLSARPGGTESGHQPLRVIMGLSATAGAQVWRDQNAVLIPSHDPREVLDHLWHRDVRTVIVEGGSTVISAFLAASLIDELQVYIAPAILGGGVKAVAGLGIDTMAEALRAEHAESLVLGADTLIRARVRKED